MTRLRIEQHPNKTQGEDEGGGRSDASWLQSAPPCRRSDPWKPNQQVKYKYENDLDDGIKPNRQDPEADRGAQCHRVGTQVFRPIRILKDEH